MDKRTSSLVEIAALQLEAARSRAYGDPVPASPAEDRAVREVETARQAGRRPIPHRRRSHMTRRQEEQLRMHGRLFRLDDCCGHDPPLTREKGGSP